MACMGIYYYLRPRGIPRMEPESQQRIAAVLTQPLHHASAVRGAASTLVHHIR